MEIRTQFSYDQGKVIFGTLIYYTLLDGKDWYNRSTKLMEAVEINENLYPNAKELEYFFIPEAHRFCIVNKSNGVGLSQVYKFLDLALPIVLGNSDKKVIVTYELTKDVIDKIITADKLFKIEVDLSYSNNDLTEEFEKYFDDDVRDGKIENLNINAKSFKNETIDINQSSILKAALKLSQSNGFANATIENSKGIKENISTLNYPRKEMITTIEGREHIDVLNSILKMFRNVQN